MLKGCIVVVEDDQAIATVVEETLSAERYEVVCAGAVGALRLTVPW
jgi:DNA-binding response OmpR family regulator